MYFNILPKIIGGIGWVLAKITRQPKFESFFGIEMMFLGNTEALAVSNEQLKRMNEMRVSGYDVNEFNLWSYCWCIRSNDTG